MLVAAAFVPIPPLLVPEIAAGSAAADESLRQACRAAVARLLGAALDELVVVGPATVDGPVDGGWDWRGFGVPSPEAPPTRRLPLGLGIGSWLLDTQAHDVPVRRHHGVSIASPAALCAATGRELVAGPARVGLLVCGDGTACRSEKAPGHLVPAAQAWDDTALGALQDAAVAALLALDPDAATRLMAVGRAPWQVLAGAAGDAVFDARIDWAEAPYGVMYIAGTWLRREANHR
jgi:hypothetical protein